MTKLPEKMSNGQYPAFAWPGGYPIFYLTSQCTLLCSKCASDPDVVDTGDVGGGESLYGADIHWEGAPEVCEGCNEAIESAYGEVD